MKRTKKLLISIICLIVVLSAGCAGYFYYKINNSTPKMQAVFLTNGQVYFAKIAKKDSQFIILKEIYYLKNQDSLDNSQNTDKTKISLVKLGDELHGPEDIMYINRQQILFYEDLKSDSKITQAIEKHLADNSAK